MDWTEARSRLSGVYLAIPTLFRDEDLELNLEGMRRHVRFLLEGGVREGNAVLLTCGAAGDFSTLSVEERVRVTETVLDEVAGKVGVVLGAQSSNLREVIALARAAARLGAVAIQVSPPFYHAHTDGDVYEFFEAAAEAADVGVVIYPTYWKGYKMPLDVIDRLAELPSVIGLKWAAPHFYEYERGLRRFADRLCVVDNQLVFVHSHMLGARGMNMHSTNYWPEWGVKTWELYEAREYRKAMEETVRVLSPYYDLCAEVAEFTGGEGHLDKLCLELIGLDSSRCRPPTRDIRAAFRDKAREMLLRCNVPRVDRGLRE
jgi:dihydrodipicolinate synthase/N-acetylneuraminate lyase